MQHLSSQSLSLFLREEELKRGAELILRAHRALADASDTALSEHGLGHADFRALFLIGRYPGLSISDLQHLLRIKKQSLARVLDHLAAEGLVEQHPDRRDRRRRALRLTERGSALERRLFASVRTRIAAAYRRAGADAVGGFWEVLAALAGEAPTNTDQ